MAYILPTVALNLVLFFGSGWLALGPMLGYLQKPYGWILATQAGSAWLAVALVWAFPGRYSLLHGLAGRNPQRLYLAGERRIWLYGAWFPTAFVFVIYYRFVSTVHPLAVLLPAFAIGIVLFAAAAAPDHELWSDFNRLDLVLGAVLCIAYGCAAALQVNCVFDRSNGAVYETTVTAKRDYHRSDVFRRGPHLTVAPWGPEHEPRSLAVPYALYQSVVPGDRVCMVLRKGALGMSWYTAQSCPYKGTAIFLEPGGAL